MPHPHSLKPACYYAGPALIPAPSGSTGTIFPSCHFFKPPPIVPPSPQKPSEPPHVSITLAHVPQPRPPPRPSPGPATHCVFSYRYLTITQGMTKSAGAPVQTPTPAPPPRRSCQHAHGPRLAQDPRNSPAEVGKQTPRGRKRLPEADQQGSRGAQVHWAEQGTGSGLTPAEEQVAAEVAPIGASHEHQEAVQVNAFHQ